MGRSVALAAAALSLAWRAAADPAPADAKPHIVLIVADDFGFDDAGFRNGGQIHTPAIDALAAEGILLDNYYVQPSCSPTRSCIMSGRAPLHTGINNYIPNSPYGLPLDEVTLAQLLGGAGYKCHAVGKWHLGFHLWDFTPTFRGFDSFYGFYFGSQDYYTHVDVSKPALDFHRQSRPRCGWNCTVNAFDDQGTYSTILFAREAERIIAEHDPTTPLFLYQAFQAVHSPRQVPAYYSNMYAGKIQDPARQVFAGMVHCLSEGISNITSALAARGMMNNTVIVFTTDNGGPIHECAGIGASNYPLRGGKCSVLEGGTKGTALVHSKILAKSGYHFSGLFHAVDWLPTLVHGAAGVGIAGQTKPLDGVDQWDALCGRAPSPRTHVYYGLTDSSVGLHGPAIRDADGNKLILNGFGGSGLWNPLPHAGGGLLTSGRAGSSSVCDPYAVHDKALMPGDVITSAPVGNGSDAVDACCGKCSAQPGCVAFTVNWAEGVCFLQSSACVARQSCDIRAGGNTVGTALNPPSPNCTAKGSFCDWLFNVAADEREQHPVNVTADPAARATRDALNATLQQLWSTREPQASPEQPNQCRIHVGGNCTCPHPIGPCVDVNNGNRTFVCPYCEPDAPLHPMPFDVDPAAES